MLEATQLSKSKRDLLRRNEMSKFIPISEPSITERDIASVTRAVKSGWVSSQGEYLKLFESNFARYIGTKYALTTCNGTVALHLVLESLGIKEGDEVIVPDFTFIATANAVAYTGAKPVLVDIERDTWCIDPASVRKALTSRTKAIIPVHLYGHPADMGEINKIAKENNLYVVEDAAEAHGATYEGKKVGGLGQSGVFSFYGNKIITTGEGGMITTNDDAFYEKAKNLRDHAMSPEKRYWHTEVGYNYRMTNLQAALGVAQLERIEKLIKKKRQIFGWYHDALKDVEGISLNVEKKWARNVYWMVCLVLDDALGVQRDDLMKSLKSRNIDSRPFFYPMSQMPMYKNGTINPTTYDISRRGLNLPSSVKVQRHDVEYIASAIKDILKSPKKGN